MPIIYNTDPDFMSEYRGQFSWRKNGRIEQEKRNVEWILAHADKYKKYIEKCGAIFRPRYFHKLTQGLSNAMWNLCIGYTSNVNSTVYMISETQVRLNPIKI